MAKRKRTFKTPVQQEYYKQRKRIQNYISKQKKKGVFIQKDILPSIPRHITQASIERLKGLTPQRLREFSIESNPEHNQGLTNRFSKTIMRNFKYQLLKYPTGRYLIGKIEELERQYGTDAVATMFDDASFVMGSFAPEIGYDYIKAQEWFDSLLEFMPDMGEFEKQLLMSEVEYEMWHYME